MHDASGWRSSIAARGTPGQVQTKPVSSPGEEMFIYVYRHTHIYIYMRGTPGQVQTKPVLRKKMFIYVYRHTYIYEGNARASADRAGLVTSR